MQKSGVRARVHSVRNIGDGFAADLEGYTVVILSIAVTSFRIKQARADNFKINGLIVNRDG